MNGINNKYTFLIVILLAIMPRVIMLGDNEFYGDEYMHIEAAKTYMKSGDLGEEYFWHPPFKHILQYAGIALLGDNPYGWRLPNAIAGSISVILLFLIARKLFDSAAVALMSSVILAVDPLHVLFSRTTFGEVPGMMFFLGAVYSVVSYERGSRYLLPLAGLGLGLAHAIKWYYIPAHAFMGVYILYVDYRAGQLSLSRFAYILSSLFVLPFTIYIFSFYIWFGMGNQLSEFIPMQIDALRELRAIGTDFFINKFLSMSPSQRWWLIWPYVYGVSIGAAQETWNRFFIFINNFPFWMISVPSAAYLFIKEAEDRPGLIFVVVLFMATYLQFAFSMRPIFLYSSMACMPFVYLMAGAGIARFAVRRGGIKWLYICVSATVLWGLYLYPLATGRLVPVALYKPIFMLGNIY